MTELIEQYESTIKAMRESHAAVTEAALRVGFADGLERGLAILQGHTAKTSDESWNEFKQDFNL